MPEKWTGKLLGEMHNERVTRTELANELGCTKAYVCMVLNGQKTAKGVEERFANAFKSILERRNARL